MKQEGHNHFYGTSTVGERGQAVIPAEARESMNIEKGEKLLVFGMGSDMIAFVKLSKAEKYMVRLSNHLEAIRKITEETK